MNQLDRTWEAKVDEKDLGGFGADFENGVTTFGGLIQADGQTKPEILPGAKLKNGDLVLIDRKLN